MKKTSSRANKSIVAFKLDSELASILDAMPNKSEFIRAAVESRLMGTCPLCHGSGVAPRGIGDELARVVEKHPPVACGSCGASMPRPCHAPGHCEEDQRDATFSRFGTYFCETCYKEAAHCTECERPFVPHRPRQVRCELCRAA